MPSYEQTGKRYCKSCKEYSYNKRCPICGAETQARGKWTVRFRVIENEKEVNKRLSGFDKKQEAETAYLKYIAQYEKPKKSAPYAIPFWQLYDSYDTYIQNNCKESGYITITGKAKKNILPYFKNKIVSEITTLDIDKWKNSLNEYQSESGKKYSDKYKASLFSILVAILNYAKKYFKLQENVASIAGNFAKREKKKEMQFWTEKEFLKFYSKIDDITYQALFLTLYLIGCRKGECLALTWNDIDFNTKMLNIDKSITRKVSGKTFEVTTPKNESSYRKVMMPDNLIEVLKDYRQSLSPVSPQDFVFQGSKPMSETTIERRMIQYCEMADVKKIRVHDLRHSNASLLISKGLNVVLIAKRLGHSNIEQTLNTYSHMFPTDEEKAADALNFPLFLSSEENSVPKSYLSD